MSGKVKMSVAKKTMKDPELLDLFNQMCGAGDPDPNIAIPKYDKLLDESKKIIKLLQAFTTSPFAGVFKKDYITAFDEINAFCMESMPVLEHHTLKESGDGGALSGEKLNALNANQELLQKYIDSINSKYDIKDLSETYTNLKQCRPVQEIVMIVKNIKNVLTMEKERTKSEEHNLENRKSLSMTFIQKCEGDSLKLFNFSSLDFKQISYNEDLLTQELQNYMLYFLHILYKRGVEVVNMITSPDIDVGKFSEVLVRNIGEVKKHIPGCDKAFGKIASSVNLLKSNFDGYYKDFVISQNPGIIIESFVGDVAQDSKADPMMTSQFRKIIQFYKQKMNAAKIEDPKIKKILGMVGSNLDVLESETASKKRRDPAAGTDVPSTPDPSVQSNPSVPPEHDMSDPKVRQEIADSFLPDNLKSGAQKSKSKGKGARKPVKK